MTTQFATPLSGYWWSDLLLALALLLVLLYLARQPVHELLHGLGRSASGLLRSGAMVLRSSHRNLTRLARFSLMQMAREHQERLTRRQLKRLEEILDEALEDWPGLRGRIEAAIKRIESDHRHPPEQPEPPTAWADLLERITGIDDGRDPAVSRAIEAVHESIRQTSRELAEKHYQANRDYQDHLEGLRPEWERIATDSEAALARLDTLSQELRDCRRRLQRFDTLQRQRGILTSRLRGWLGIQFLVGLAVGGLAIMVGVVNFHLIALPLQEAMGADSRVGPWMTASVAATTMTALMVALAMLISDGLGFTRFFGGLERFNPGQRRLITHIAGGALLVLCFAEAGLAFVRDSLVLEQAWLARELETGVATGEPGLRWIPSLAQMLIGFVLPLSFLIMAPAIESLLQSGRVLLVSAAGMLAAVGATLLRLLARLLEQTAGLLAYLYDLVIFLPLAAARSLEGWRRRQREGPDL